MMTCAAAADAALTVLLIDDSESQSDRIQRCLCPYGVRVEWRRSYRAAVALLRDPDLGQLVDLVLIDQAFDADTVELADLLTAAEVDAHAGTEEWDVRLHQGLFILTRLGQDMRHGLIPFTPMMILTHYGKLEIAARTGELGGYLSKRSLLTDPYTALKRYLEGLRPTPADVARRVEELVGELRLDAELVGQVQQTIMAGVDPDSACAALRRLDHPHDWGAVWLALDRLADDRLAFPPERLAQAVMGAWFSSSEGWLQVRQVEPLGALGRGFQAYRLEIAWSGDPFAALLAARAVPADEMPGSGELEQGFGLLRQVDARSRPVRLRAGWWTVLGCWLPEPPRPDSGAEAAARRLIAATQQVRDLHGRGLAHGSLTVTSAAFEQPVFGGIRFLTGDRDLAGMRRDDLLQLPLIAAAAFGEEPPAGARQALDEWSAAIATGELEAGERILRTEAIAELARLSAGHRSPTGVETAVALPQADPQARAASRRALHWTTTALSGELTRMRTWRSRWSVEAWDKLLPSLTVAQRALDRLPELERPFALVALRAYDDAGEPRDIEAASLELVEYDVRVPRAASPLAGYFPDSRSQAARRRMAADVLRAVVHWERSGLAYRTMGPTGVVCADGRVYCDLLQSVVPIDQDALRRQRCGAAACLVLLLSPWPYAWPAILAGSLPVAREQPGEGSAWGIAAPAVMALLEADPEPLLLGALLERAELLDAAARLDRRFPEWPAGLASEARQ